MLAIREATVRGRLYDLPYGFPALVVPKEDIHMVGTANYLADTEAQNHASPDPGASPPPWDTVYGELFSFDDPEERLPALDGLEGFRPGEKGLYRRVLIPVTPAETDTAVLAWAYAVGSANGVYLPGGRWPAQ